ncbi:M-phase inducer phosphatase 1 [Astathelohania contejeani]|uniref:protein-tyrosine-phosphatase n=1 Tax=Astathelohania contejeani TaxID=164912 RepID=A0ABQ7I0N7_9MICR|nr:M-phase inducer phosphatase 1 [Thelohania contejeani]
MSSNDISNQVNTENPFIVKKNSVKHWSIVSKKRAFTGSVLFYKRKRMGGSGLSRAFSAPVLSGNPRDHLIDFWCSVDNGEVSRIPTIGVCEGDSLQRITPSTLCDLIDRKYDIEFYILDCRYFYEFQGGHIKGALCLNSTESIERFMQTHQRAVLIFHCEYSSVRGPRMATYLRNKDRASNIYPALKFPEIYILDGGYKRFYEEKRRYCDPPFYISMVDPRFRKEYTIEASKK